MSILLFLFRLFSVARSCRFWHSVLPRAHVSFCYIYKLHSVCICSSFPGMRRFCLFFVTSWPMLYVATLIKFILRRTFSSSFPGRRRFWLFCNLMAGVIRCYIYENSFCSTFCSSFFPVLEGFGIFCYLMADVICYYIY